MNCIRTPIALELLLQHYYLAVVPPPESDAHKTAFNTLVSEALVDPVSGNVTPRGAFYIHHLLSVPFPVETVTYTIPTPGEG